MSENKIHQCPAKNECTMHLGGYCNGEISNVGHWAENPFTGDVSFIVCTLESGDQVLIKPTHWKNLTLPPE